MSTEPSIRTMREQKREERKEALSGLVETLGGDPDAFKADFDKYIKLAEKQASAKRGIE